MNLRDLTHFIGLQPLLENRSSDGTLVIRAHHPRELHGC